MESWCQGLNAVLVIGSGDAVGKAKSTTMVG